MQNALLPVTTNQRLTNTLFAKSNDMTIIQYSVTRIDLRGNPTRTERGSVRRTVGEEDSEDGGVDVER